MCVVLTPTLNSCAGARSLRSGTNSASASPSEVESPMYTTERHEVCVAGGSGLRGADDVAEATAAPPGSELVERLEPEREPPEPPLPQAPSTVIAMIDTATRLVRRARRPPGLDRAADHPRRSPRSLELTACIVEG